VQKLIADMERAAGEKRPVETPPATAASQPAPAPAVTPTVAAPAVVAETPPAASASSGRGLRIGGLAVGVFGLAAIGAGGGFYAVASSANDSLNHPGDGFYSHDAEQRRDSFQSLSIASFAVGSAALAAGVTLYVVGWRQQHRASVHATGSSGHAAPLSLGF
jgi:hypothetical protein